MFGHTNREIVMHKKFASELRTVEVDQGQLERVFLNLFVNTWQAMPGGHLYLAMADVLLDEIYTRHHNCGPGQFVRITITDTGVGVDAKTSERIFEPFFTTKEMGRGAGLGLASVYGIIKSHGGIITANSEQG